MEALPILLAVFWTVLVVWGLTQLPPLHPVQLWAIPWFAVSFLYALRIIPYQPLEPLTAALIAAGGLAFAAGALLGERLLERSRPKPRAQERTAVELAAAAASAIALLMLAAFLVEAIPEVGLKPTLLNDSQLRTAIGADSFPVTIKYVYASIAAATLCAIAAARGPWQRRSVVWAALSLLAVGSLYFATGRATIALAGVSAAVAAVLTAGVPVTRRQLVAAAATFGALVLAVFVSVGELQGKTTESSELRAVPTRWDDTALSELKLPYEYATAPIAALNELVQETPAVGGTGGCATLRVPCAALQTLGLGTEPEPVIRGYTAPPLRWNTYTALDLPLIDGGWLFAPPILLLTGIAVGAAWSFARDGSTFGVLLYSIAAFALLYGPIQYSFLASHLVGAAVFAIGLLVVAGLGIRRSASSRSAARALQRFQRLGQGPVVPPEMRSAAERAYARSSASPRTWAGLLAGLAFVVRLPLFFSRNEVTSSSSDGTEYLGIADALVSGEGFVTDAVRPPGYPVFLGALQVLPGRTEDVAAIAQHLLGVVMVAAIVLLTWRLLGRGPAVLAGLLAALSPSLVQLEQWVLSDMLFGGLVFAGAWTLAFAARRSPPSTSLLAWSGGVFGLAILVRPIGQALFLVAPLVLLFATRSWRLALRGTALTTGVIVVVVAPWVVNNAVTEDFVGVSRLGAVNLFNRAFAENEFEVPTDSEEGRIAAAVLRRMPAGSRLPYSEVLAAYEKRGIDRPEGMRELGALGSKAIRENLGPYLERTAYVLWAHRRRDDFSEWGFPTRRWGLAYPDLEADLGERGGSVLTGASTAAFPLFEILDDVVWLLALGGAAVPLLLVAGRQESRIAAASLLATWLAVALGTAATARFEPRFAYELTPLSFVLLSATAIRVLQVAWLGIRAGTGSESTTPVLSR